MDSPTIVVARLDDKELQESIKSMVDTFNQSLNRMKTHADSVVSAINESLKGIKGGSVSSGGASDGGSAKRAKAYSEEGKQIEQNVERQKEYNATLDQTAAIIQKAAGGKKKGIEYMTVPSGVDKELTYLIDINDKVGRQLGDAMQKEQALLDAKNREVAISQEAAQAQQQVTNAVSGTAIAYGDVHKMAEQALGIKHNADGSKKKEATDAQYLREQLASLLEVEQREVTLTNTKQASYNELSAELKQLTSAYHRLGADIAKTEGADIAQRIQTIQREMQKFQQTMSRPVSWEAVNSLPTNTLDDIAYKLRQLQAYKGGLNLATQKQEINDVNAAIDSLRRDQLKYMSDAQKLTGINAALGRSWNYMKNRLAYYFTVTTSVSLAKQVAEIRGQYELMERSIGILVNDMSRGTDIFNKLNDMALRSPFTMLELGSAAKQLVAFNIAADDVVDTTRRLADMAAAVGLPIERLTYALGQVKAYGYLNSRDSRIFLNAGIPIVQMLTDMYNRQRDVDEEMVTASQVRDMMTKRMISYADVMKVVNEATDAGGRFFNFQERAAETLKVKIANLSLAWNNMLNDVGASNQGFMSGGLRVVTSMLKHWREFSRVLSSLIVTIGVYKTVASMVAVQNDRMVTTGMLASLQKWVGGIKKASGAMATLNAVMGRNPVLFGATLITALTSYFLFFRDTVGDAGRKVKELNDSIEGVSKQMSELYVKAMTTDNLNSQIEDLRQMLDRIQSDFGITIPVNLEDVDEGNIKAKIQEVKSRIDSYLAFTETFGTAALENEKLGDSFEKFGTAATTTFNNITNNLAVVKEGMLALGATADEVTLLDRQEGESTVEYLSRIISLYEQLQILRKSELENVYKTPMAGGLPVLSQDNIYDLEKMQSSALDALGVKNKAVFQNMLKDVQDYYSTLSLSKSAFNKFARELEKQLDVNNILDVNERTLKVEAAIEKYSAQKGLTQTATELLKYLANQRYKTNIQVGVDPNAKKEVEQELKDWQIELQKEADKQGIKLKVTFTAEQTEAGYAAEALKQVKDAQEELAVLRRKKAAGTASQEDIDEAIKKLDNLRKAARLAGADLSSLNKGGGSKKDTVLDALKTEIKLVEQLQGEYDKLTKSGANSEEALATIRGAFGNTIKQLNSQLRGYGLPELTTQLITGKDPNKALAHFKQTLQSLVDKGMMSLERSKEVEAIIEKLTISAKTYNLDKITKGLNSELDKLKEEYELAIALDADPELGDVFASYFGIDKEQLPHDFEQVANKAQQYIDKILKENHYEGAAIDIESLLSKESFDKWVKDSGQELNSELVKQLEAFREYLHKTQVDEIKSQEESWQKLLEKYAEYEYKRTQIAKTADKERETIVEKFGSKEQKETYAKIKTELDTETDPEKKDALKSQLIELVDSIASSNDTALQIKTSIDTKELRDYADLDFTEFQKTGVWAIASGDLTGMTKTALKGLIDSLEEYKQKARNLDPKQIKQINRALKALHSEVRKDNPFSSIADTMEQASLRSEELQDDIDKTQLAIDKINAKYEEGAQKTKEDEEAIRKLNEQLQNLQGQQQALSKVSMKTVMDEVTKFSGAISGAASMVGDLAQAFGDTATAKAVQDIGTVLDKIGQGASLGGSVGGGWGAFAGAIVGGAAGILQVMSDAITGNAKINDQIEDSERRVRRLGNAYKYVEYNVEKAIGTGKVGVRQWNVELKKLELAEVERQLRLEESRTSKNRDEDKIIELKGSLIDLRHEIEESTDEIVNDLLGISSVGDAVETLVSSMIDAFKKGEDYMKEYDESFSEMIDNMIVKSISSKVVGDVLNKVWSELDKKTKERGEKYTKPIFETGQGLTAAQEGIKQAQEAYLNWVKIWQDAKTVLDNSGYSQAEKSRAYKDMKVAEEKMREFATILNVFGIQLPTLQDTFEKLSAEQKEAMRLTPEDVQDVRDTAKNARDEAKRIFDEMMAAYGITFGQDKEGAQLSALQAGIQGVTEETAGALEAITSGMYQQVSLQSTLLTQIRDVVIGLNPDITLGVQSQMLLQLQNSYVIQQTILSTMQGWSSPTGNSIRVVLEN